MKHDLLVPGLMVVFCRTAAGHASARQGKYYPGRGNKSWENGQGTGYPRFPTFVTIQGVCKELHA